MSKSDDGNVNNNSNNQTFREVVEARMSRRGFLGSGLAAAATLSLGSIESLVRAVPASAKTRGRPGARARTRFPMPPIHARQILSVPSCAGTMSTTSRSRHSIGTSSLSAVIRTTRTTARRSTATSRAHRTASIYRRTEGCGSRPTCRETRLTRGRTPVSATIRWCAPTRPRGRLAGSSWGRDNVR